MQELAQIFAARQAAAVQDSSAPPHASQTVMHDVVVVSFGALAVGVAAGIAAAGFLYLLELATRTRLSTPWLIVGLPFVGAALVSSYRRFGRVAQRGMSVILDDIAATEPLSISSTVPRRMAPMVLAGTLVTHLFGGSAGREGTAVQMSASMASTLASVARTAGMPRRLFLVAGIAGGFGAVFGTPIAGSLFALEVIRRRVPWRMVGLAIVPATIAAFVGDRVCLALGTVHTPFDAGAALPLDGLLIAKWLALAVAAAGCAHGYIWLVDTIRRYGAVLPAPLLAALGGAVVVVALLLVDDLYAGLGVPTIVRAFSDPALPNYAFAMKLGLTAVTIAVGMIGGEVTPLFFVGATLGNAMATWLGVPIALAAAVGMVAVFAAAARTPLALIAMAGELFGGHVMVHAAIAIAGAELLMLRTSIYALWPKPAPAISPPS
ncbi:MAG TPA: chloride channel protein [Kofleriaceae bacterium]|nr:chloride channel protein [Kofleriaceae bacterium]